MSTRSDRPRRTVAMLLLCMGCGSLACGGSVAPLGSGTDTDRRSSPTDSAVADSAGPVSERVEGRDASIATIDASTGAGGDCPIEDELYRDFDGDGYGSFDAPIIGCVDPDKVPPGYTRVPGDCNDAIAQIHPFAVELADDDVDSDCDGSDDTVGCDARWCSCQLTRNAADAAVDPTCTSVPDPFVSALQACGGCGDSELLAIVGNRGGAPTPAGIVLSLTLDNAPLSQVRVDESIAPGGLVVIKLGTTLVGGDLQVQLSSSADCNASNDRGATYVTIALCH